MDRKLYAPFIWLVVFMLVVGLACSVQLTDEKEPTATTQKEKPTKRPTATESVATEEPTLEPVATEIVPTSPPVVQPTEAPSWTEEAQPGVTGNPNASESGEVYFQTEFDDVEGWWLRPVPEVNQSKYRVFEDNGQLYMEINPQGVTLYAFYDLVLNNPDVQVDTVAQKVAGPNTNNLSIICRASDAGWYEFSMTSGGYWFIWLYYNGKYSQLATGASRAINMKNQANQLTATCIGSNLTFYINQVKLGAVTERTLRDGGWVGVSIFSEYPDLGVVFEWFSAIVP